jgi:Tfp pilus assembly protein PilF
MKSSDLQRAVALLEAGDWQAAHEIVQRDEDSALSCWAHGIVHMLEGDASNARYWYRQAKRPFPREASAAKEIASLKKELASK